MNLKLSTIPIFDNCLSSLPNKKLLINTINAHCFNIAQEDKFYAKALYSSDVLLPDGISIVFANRTLNSKKIKKIAGEELFYYEMNRLNNSGGKSFFLGSDEKTLALILENAKVKFPNVEVFTYSPPYKNEFSSSENELMIDKINKIKPDVLFIGMTAPKQEKWAFQNLDKLEVGHICCIGAVFNFFAGNIKRAPKWMISFGLEWFYRLIMEPRRLWRRYIIGNFRFLYLIMKEKFSLHNT